VKSKRNADTAYPPIGSYSQQVEVSGTPRWLVISGQVGRTLDRRV
jgi:enamine deaminase RidA (YjgF/YER057c/UK114 family)